MTKILLACDWGEKTRVLSAGLEQAGFVTCLITNGDLSRESVAREAPDLMIMDFDGTPASLRRMDLAGKLKQETGLPSIALVARESLGELPLSLDDFVVKPCQTPELVTRIKRVLKQKAPPEGSESVTCGDLVINLAKCEVTLAGKPVDLAFREYELLKFLVANRERVFTREALLNKVWGYDYFGGERTVDVHVRRLRSKIEETGQVFIETVRNIGYRFKA